MAVASGYLTDNEELTVGVCGDMKTTPHFCGVVFTLSGW